MTESKLQDTFLEDWTVEGSKFRIDSNDIDEVLIELGSVGLDLVDYQVEHDCITGTLRDFP